MGAMYLPAVLRPLPSSYAPLMVSSIQQLTARVVALEALVRNLLVK